MRRSARLRRIRRDTVLFSFSLGLIAYGAGFGGNQTGAIMTAGVSLLLSPIVLRLDEARRNGGDQ